MSEDSGRRAARPGREMGGSALYAGEPGGPGKHGGPGGAGGAGGAGDPGGVRDRSGTTAQVRRVVGAAAVVLATAAVMMPTGFTATAANVVTVLSGKAPDGIWRADGNGEVVVVRHGRVWTYGATSLGCLTGPRSGRQSGRPGRDRAVRFVDQDGNPLLTIRAVGARSARIDYDGGAGDLAMRRLPALPAGCPAGGVETSPLVAGAGMGAG